MSRVQLGNAVFKAARPTPVDLKECGHRGRCPSIIFCAEPREPKSFCARCMKSCRWHDDREHGEVTHADKRTVTAKYKNRKCHH